MMVDLFYEIYTELFPERRAVSGEQTDFSVCVNNDQVSTVQLMLSLMVTPSLNSFLTATHMEPNCGLSLQIHC